MAGCEVKNSEPGRNSEGRVLGWVFGGAGLGALVGYLNAANIAGTASGGLVGLLGVLIVAFAALAGAELGFAIGFAVNWFDSVAYSESRDDHAKRVRPVRRQEHRVSPVERQ
jgi:hypothetical protein